LSINAFMFSSGGCGKDITVRAVYDRLWVL